tara:strand:- start:328 stop:615 length:288 start_codon:yes stop_codon:yes gene_type:complete
MTTKKVQVIKDYGFSISTNVEIPADAEIKDVWVKWDSMELITTDGIFNSEIDLTDYDVDYKRPFNIMVFEENKNREGQTEIKIPRLLWETKKETI